MSDKLFNLTPHVVTVAVSGDNTVRITPSGLVARVAMQYEPLCDTRPGLPVVAARYGEVEVTASDGSTVSFEDFAAAQADDVVYIVSRVVAEALRQGLPGALAARIGRVYVPATGPGMAVRDGHGRIVAVRALEAIDLT